MNIGMLWFDNDTKADFFTRIDRAAVYYRQKYGKTPTVCYVHPSMIPQKTEALPHAPIKNGNIEVRENHSVLPNHFWIGVNGATPQKVE
jgi:hypothetical protein